MPHLSIILACGNMGITTGDVVLFFMLAACWLAACILCLVNLVIIFRTSRELSFRRTHSLIFLSYIGLATFLFCLPKIITKDGVAAPIGMVLTIAIPLFVIGHFIYLMICRRRLKHERKQDA